MRRQTWMLLCTLAVFTASPAETEPTDRFDATHFTWEQSTPEEQGIDSEALLQGLRRIRDEEIDAHGLIVIRNNRVILECYVHPYDRDTLHNVKSVSKSIISAVAGIALREGILESLDQTVHEFFPQYIPDDTDPRKKQITVRHLLSMTSGLKLDENGPIMREVSASDDWIRAAFSQEMADDPGKRFSYSTPLTHTVSAILTEAGGKSLLELTEQHLFGPLGIENVQWTKGPKGYYVGGAELFLTPRDMAKFGVLFLNGGRWRGKQIVPATWVRESTRNQLPTTETGRQYGYGWWLDGESRYSAMGWGGQGIAIDPKIGFVAVGTAADHNASAKIFRGFRDHEPSDEPLPPNPKAVAALAELARELEHPTPEPVPELPEIAGTISGQRYALESNPRGVHHVTFEFPGGSSARVILETASGKLDLEIGLDGIFRVSPAGDFGSMPTDNRLAHRGAWTSPSTFTLDSHEMGNPLHGKMRVEFKGDRIEFSGTVRPIGRDFTWAGRKADPGKD